MLKTRIRKWCLLLLLLGCCMGVQAQYSMGNTGLLNIPTADMQKAGTFMGGGNYLPNGMTPLTSTPEITSSTSHSYLFWS